jgi:hypothetical protein
MISFDIMLLLVVLMWTADFKEVQPTMCINTINFLLAEKLYEFITIQLHSFIN